VTSFWHNESCSLVKVDDVSEVHITSTMTAVKIFIFLMMKSISTSETSGYLYEATWLNNPEGCDLQINFTFTKYKVNDRNACCYSVHKLLSSVAYP
jgi:hypothetical protein